MLRLTGSRGSTLASRCQRWFQRSLTVLGIESSCDDTGVAIVTDKKEILAETLHSQGRMHREFGGIIPTLARDLHVENISKLVAKSFCQSELSIQDVDAIAVSVKPGLTLSLLVGLNHARDLAHLNGKPLIPIHHMQAHALTARCTNDIDFPYLVLLMSGGHCLLAVVEDVSKFKILGTCIDTSPGDMLDKTARRLKLKSLPHLEDCSGGAAIERLALTGDPLRYPFPQIMPQLRDCNFSFSGLQFCAKKIIVTEEHTLGLGACTVIPSVADLCASLQNATLQHMAKRLYRGFMFCDMKSLLPSANRVLVLSGGVASNTYIREGLAAIAEMFDCEIVCPPPRLCTDNGVMIAWNGVEKMLQNIDVYAGSRMEDLCVEHRSPLGSSLVDEVRAAALRVRKADLQTAN